MTPPMTTPQTNTPLISARGLTKRFGDFWTLRDLDLEIVGGDQRVVFLAQLRETDQATVLPGKRRMLLGMDTEVKRNRFPCAAGAQDDSSGCGVMLTTSSLQ